MKRAILITVPTILTTASTYLMVIIYQTGLFAPVIAYWSVGSWTYLVWRGGW